MLRLFRLSVLQLLLLLALPQWSAYAADAAVGPERAFQLRARLEQDGRRVTLLWDIAPGYKLYRDHISATVAGGRAVVGPLALPKGIATADPLSGERQEIYHGRLTAAVPVAEADGPFELAVTYQGCSDAGVCYPPANRYFRVDPGQPGALPEVMAATAAADPGMSAGLQTGPPPAPSATASDASTLARSVLEGGHILKVSAVFFLFGVLLSLTPCILPMVPILSAIIVGGGEHSRRKGLLLAVAYCLGMATVYTALGVAAGLAGEGLAGAFQKPWVLVSFALFLLVLSLSMFDLYQLQLPLALQNRLNNASSRLPGGRLAGVFLMGLISALVVGPCVAAPLAGTLIYISQTGNVLLGGVALFCMACGMSLPLLLVGVSARHLLPKAGGWMVGVKRLFGIMLVAVSIWMVTPVFSQRVLMLCWGGLALLCAVLAGLFSPVRGTPSPWRRAGRAAGIVFFTIGLVEFVGAASGAEGPLRPLSGLFRKGESTVGGQDAPLVFRPVKSIAELDREVTAAAGRPVMVDFSADWCVSCKELEQFTFTNGAVRRRLAEMVLLRVDVTANTAEDRALMKRFGLFGPPGIIFFDRNGQEVANARIVGFIRPDAFLKQLEAVF